jgi:hypothetical protein
MGHDAGALAWAEAQVAAARDDPAARLALLARTYHGPTGRAPRHLPFRRAALSFMRWQARRGVIDPLDASPPGSLWWRRRGWRWDGWLRWAAWPAIPGLEGRECSCRCVACCQTAIRLAEHVSVRESAAFVLAHSVWVGWVRPSP